LPWEVSDEKSEAGVEKKRNEEATVRVHVQNEVKTAEKNLKNEILKERQETEKKRKKVQKSGLTPEVLNQK